MKRISYLLVLAMSILAVPASAYDIEVDGIYYDISVTDMTASVTYKGTKYSGDIVIPSSITYASREISVTSIGSFAFSDCSSLTSVVIPNSVTSIERDAFYGCSSLTSIVIPNSVTSIGNYAFQNCSSLASVTIGNSLKTINDYAFQNCSSLTSVVIPNSVTSIKRDAFYGCSSLTSIVIPNSVTSIETSAFRDCSSLTSIVIPNSVTSIKDEVFYGCGSLTSVVIPNSVTSIGNYAFSNCSSLTSIVIPNSVTSIGFYAFRDCSSLTSIVIPNSVTSIETSAFRDCSSLTSIVIPNSVTSIKDEVFYGCGSLSKVIFDDGESSLNIGEKYSSIHNIFNECPLEELHIGRTIIKSSSNSTLFNDTNTKFKKITIGKYVTTLANTGLKADKCSELEVINCLGNTPPSGISDFTNVQYMTLQVNVPVGALAAYQAHNIWGKFWNLQEKDFAGVGRVTDNSISVSTDGRTLIVSGADDNTPVEVYNLNGQCLYLGMERIIANLPAGVCIVRVGNQSIKTIIY